MAPEIRTIPLEYTIYGHSLRHQPGTPFGPEILSLLGRVWPVLKGQKIPSDGINRVVYDGGSGSACTVFAGVALSDDAAAAAAAAGLETKTIRLTHYAVWTHIGPYHLIPTTGAAMSKALEAQGHRTGWPMVEVYGHWTNDESKLQTQTFVAIR